VLDELEPGRDRRVQTPPDPKGTMTTPAGAGCASLPLPQPVSAPSPSDAPPPAPDHGGRGFSHSKVSALTRIDRMRLWVLGVLWVLVNVAFWRWWLSHTAHSAPWLYGAETAALLYQTTLLPTVFWRFLGRMKRPVEIAPRPDVRAAMITLCVPALESLPVIREQLEALRGVTYPHDSWILDEGGSPDVRALAEEHGVRYFTRHGIERWNQPAPPFQAATKAGNVNAWLDHLASLGIDYEVFVQLDIDHTPRPDYLDRVLGYFDDATVGWVQAPSVCGNLDSWTARGLAEQDLIFQGPLQMGFYGATGTPFIIGSHTSYRTQAIREIGGFQPTRAEDHLDTVVLAAHGYTGVFVPELIAVGDGPDDLATYLRQQFAWAYSMIQIFFRHTPRLIRRYTPGQALQFLFCQSWYTLWSCSLAVLWALPALALVVGRPIASVSFGEFLVYFVPVVLTSTLMWLTARRWFQPAGVRLSWRGILLETARWPVVLWALVNVVLRIKRPYMITPKGKAAGTGPRPLSIFGPYIVLTALPLAAIWIFDATTGAGLVSGYYGLALGNAVMGLLVLATTFTLDLKQLLARRPLRLAVLRGRGAVLLALVCLVALVAISVAAFGHEAIHALATRPPRT
jgi:cellulose synthase (UDP-forming)